MRSCVAAQLNRRTRETAGGKDLTSFLSVFSLSLSPQSRTPASASEMFMFIQFMCAACVVCPPVSAPGGSCTFPLFPVETLGTEERPFLSEANDQPKRINMVKNHSCARP